jgi:hypothetical protein
VVYKEKGVAHAIASADWFQVAHRMAPELFDQSGELLPLFQRPLQAKWRSSTPKTVPELGDGMYMLVSSRVRDTIEEVEPGRSLFIPIDFDPAGDLPSRSYVFYVLKDKNVTALALRKSGLEYFLFEKGRPIPKGHDWHGSDRFLYLNSAVLEGRSIYLDTVGPVFSKAIVDRLGDVLPKTLAFTPMGVAFEALDSY